MEAVAEHINEMQKIYDEYGNVFDELSKHYKDTCPQSKVWIASFGIGGLVLEWFRSFLSDRTQAVSSQNVISEFIQLRRGIPRGSVLDPLLFILDTADVERIAAQHGVDLHSYADDRCTAKHQLLCSQCFNFRYCATAFHQ